MGATNIEQLRQQILAAMRDAVSEAQEDIQKDMEDELKSFYSHGKPSRYTRTGALGETARTTDISVSGNSVSFTAYLDQSGSYTSGSNPSMGDVLRLANYGKAFTTKNGYTARPTLGKGGFWERAEERFQNSLNSALSRHFR